MNEGVEVPAKSYREGLVETMIITRTPFRMSFFGGGTDIPEFFRENGGSVISSTFDKYCYVNVRRLPPFFEYSNELVYSRIERVSDPERFEHPMVRNAMRMLDVRDLRVAYEADLPARSGLGTSSSFSVGLLNALYCLKGVYASKMHLAEGAIKLERELCQEAGGWQDQVAAAFGGFNRIDFADDHFIVRPVAISCERKRDLSANLMMFFTGFTRFSSEMQVANKVVDNTEKLKEMLALVPIAEAVLVDESRPLAEFGDLLDWAWRLKRDVGSRISTNAIDALYERGINAGAMGGKLLGAGGGGFLVFYVEPDARSSVLEALSDLTYIPFEFEDQGTSVVYFSVDENDAIGAS